MFSQDGSQPTANKTVEGAERVMMCVLEVSKPAFNGRIQIGYNLFDAVASRSFSLQTNIILKPLETFHPHIATALFKPVP